MFAPSDAWTQRACHLPEPTPTPTPTLIGALPSRVSRLLLTEKPPKDQKSCSAPPRSISHGAFFSLSRVLFALFRSSPNSQSPSSSNYLGPLLLRLFHVFPAGLSPAMKPAGLLGAWALHPDAHQRTLGTNPGPSPRSRDQVICQSATDLQASATEMGPRHRRYRMRARATQALGTWHLAPTVTGTDGAVRSSLRGPVTNRLSCVVIVPQLSSNPKFSPGMRQQRRRFCQGKRFHHLQ